MKRRQRLRPIELFLGFLILSIFFSFVSVKIWGKRLLEEDSFRQELTFQGEMTISEFGKINRLPHPLLEKVFSLTSKEDLQKKLKDFNLLQNEISGRVNNELLFQVKNENSLVKLFKWTIKKLLYNFGLVAQDIQRSGQPSPPVLWLHYELFPFKSVINLAWEPEKNQDQVHEKQFCEKRNINYYNFSWNAGGPKDWREVDRVIEIIDRCEKPVWIHCKGGKDRTGGLVAMWKKKKGYPMNLIFRDFQTHEIPAFPWVQKLLREDIGHLPSSQRSFWLCQNRDRSNR
jgi:protein tyrosine phosphatase (PTP) superfamily phosphohydrolase (DUF442 family)